MKFVLCLLFLLSFNVSAQIKPQVMQLIQDIKYEIENTHDPRVLRRVEKQLEYTLGILSRSTPYPRPNPRGKLTCVAKDDDGRAPWVLGHKDPSTFNITKLPSSNLGSLSKCNQSKDSVVYLRNSIFACVSRDNDGKHPYALTHWRNKTLVQKINNLGSLENCMAAIDAAYKSHVAVAFCGSRDDDARSPWIEISVEAQTGKVHQGRSYTNLNDCLNSAKILPFNLDES